MCVCSAGIGACCGVGAGAWFICSKAIGSEAAALPLKFGKSGSSFVAATGASTIAAAADVPLSEAAAFLASDLLAKSAEPLGMSALGSLGSVALAGFAPLPFTIFWKAACTPLVPPPEEEDEARARHEGRTAKAKREESIFVAALRLKTLSTSASGC